MHLPHLKKQEENRKWMDDQRAYLKDVLLEAINLAGPAYVLNVLAEVEAEWGSANFETAQLQKFYAVRTIKAAENLCRRITEARFKMEDLLGCNPTDDFFRELVDYES